MSTPALNISVSAPAAHDGMPEPTSVSSDGIRNAESILLLFLTGAGLESASTTSYYTDLDACVCMNCSILNHATVHRSHFFNAHGGAGRTARRDCDSASRSRRRLTECGNIVTSDVGASAGRRCRTARPNVSIVHNTTWHTVLAHSLGDVTVGKVAVTSLRKKGPATCTRDTG